MSTSPAPHLAGPSHSWRIATVHDIPIYLHYSWILACGLMLWSLAETYYPDVSPLPLDRSASWFMALGTIPLLFFCITLHELAHAMTARRYDISVHYIVLMLFGGTARYAREAPSPKAELYIAAAGPIMSMSLAIGFALLNQSTPTEPVQAAMLFLLIANTGLATFNLFPCFPMDGGRLLHAFLWHVTKDHARATKWSITVGRAFATSLISIGLFIWLTTNAATGIWIAFLGAFLYNAATAAGPSHDMA